MREVDTLIAGGTILTLDENDTRIEDGALAIDVRKYTGCCQHQCNEDE